MLIKMTRIPAYGLIFLTLMACSFNRSDTARDTNSLTAVWVQANRFANRGHPVALDLVFIRDPALQPLLISLNGPDWFRQKKGLMLKYAADMQVQSVELVPLSARQTIELPENHQSYVQVLLFANYLAPMGQYAAALGHFKRLNIRLQQSQYTLDEEAEK